MEFLKNSLKTNVLVVGDVMLDRYWWGSVSRISPEAPVPVVDLEKISATAGGAANVAANVAGLGANVFLIGIVGEDVEADLLSDTLEAKNVSAKFLIKSKERQTTIKTRIVAHNQQIVRIDRESKTELNVREEQNALKSIEKLLGQVQIVIVSDYGKGFLTENILAGLITKKSIDKRIVLVDPKGKNFRKYRRATLLTPNRLEFSEVCQLKEYSQAAVEEAGVKLLPNLSLTSLLVTQGEQGMTLFEKNKKAVHLPVDLRNVYDVTGAGDTVIACLAVAIGGGASFLEAAKFANYAAGLVIERVGTTAISLEMLGL